jgi:DNA-directed RNA polymerase I, II, and III subunit RPABC1
MNNNETGFSKEYIYEKEKLFCHIIIKNMKKKVCLKEIKDIFSKISKIHSYILIIPDKLSFDANLEIQKYKNVEIFTYDFFLFSLPRHAYVPKHILLTENEKNEFLQKRNLCIEQLPLIRKNDPVIKYYGWKKGNIVKIQRPGWIVYRAIF